MKQAGARQPSYWRPRKSPIHVTDPALDALFLPFDDGLLPPLHDALFLGARDGIALRRWLPRGIRCEQDLKPLADALAAAGTVVADGEVQPPARADVVLVLPPRQRQQARAMFARALALAAPDGRVVVCAQNSAGARSVQSDLESLAGAVTVVSKHKCRVMWTPPLTAATVDTARCRQWLREDSEQRIAGGRFVSRPGLFAWDRIDPASELLAAHLPTDIAGRVADLGAGWGYLGVELLARNPGVTALDCFEAQARALPPLQVNLAAHAAHVAVALHWADVTAGIGTGFDAIVSNPPFHIDDRMDRPQLGRRFIEVASAALRKGGRFWMVANRHLPYEATLAANFKTSRVIAHGRGFKVFEAVR